MILLSYVLSAETRLSNPLSQMTTFSVAAEIQDPHPIHFSSRHYSDVVFYDSTTQSISLLRNDGTGTFIDTVELARMKSYTSITSGNLNDDGIDDLVIVRRGRNQVIVLTSQANDSTYRPSVYSVGYYPEKVTIGDIDNDHIPDIICYGKLHSGISVLVGQKDGTFKEVKQLFPNNSASDVYIVNLNQDGFADIAIHTWLNNELTFYLGTGKLQFSEQTVLSFGSDSVQILCNDFNADGITDVAVASSMYKTVQVYHGDGLGSYNFSQTLSLSYPAESMSGASFNSSLTRDILITSRTKGCYSILLNNASGAFYDEIVYGSDSTISAMTAADLTKDGPDDILFFRRHEKTISILWNERSHRRRENEKTVTLPVGKDPVNISVSDINGDGLDDLIIPNYASASVSLVVSDGSHFRGQLSIETPDEPLKVSLYSSTDSSFTLFSVHKKNPKIAVLSIIHSDLLENNLLGDVDVFSIPLPELPNMVLPDMSLSPKGISLYVFTSSAVNGIVFYQQIKGVTFLAKSLVPLIPTEIINSTINDIDDDGRTDLIYLYNDPVTKRNYLGMTLNDSTLNYKGKVFSVEIPGSSIQRAFLSIEDFDGDRNKDCMIFSEPDQKLLLLTGEKEKSFSSPTEIFPFSVPTAPDQIQIYDYDNDGILDILFKNNDTAYLQFAKGKGNGTFSKPKNIIKLPGDSVYRLGDFNGDSITDIVYSDIQTNSVVVVYGN